MTQSAQFYTASKIFTGEGWLSDHAIVYEKGKIKEILTIAALSSDQPVTHYDDCIIAPAFIDLQVYGAGGKLFAVYPDIHSLRLLQEYCFNSGTQAFLPTVATNEKQVIFRCIDATREYWGKDLAGNIGLHLEGPWINTVKKGAHIESLIHAPSISEVKEIIEYGKGVIKMITLAPEICDDEIISYILSENIIISAGHSNATYKQSVAGFEKGISLVTHLFNAMSPFHHREPGLAGAALDNDKIMASIIPDGYHVDFPAVRIAKNVMKERLFAITDAVTETQEGFYQHKLSADKYEAGGVLSGSALTMHRAFKNLVTKVGIDASEALRMCSYYPAKAIGADDRLGKIEAGFETALIVLDQEWGLKKFISK